MKCVNSNLELLRKSVGKFVVLYFVDEFNPFLIIYKNNLLNGLSFQLKLTKFRSKINCTQINVFSSNAQINIFSIFSIKF